MALRFRAQPPPSCVAGTKRSQDVRCPASFASCHGPQARGNLLPVMPARMSSSLVSCNAGWWQSATHNTCSHEPPPPLMHMLYHHSGCGGHTRVARTVYGGEQGILVLPPLHLQDGLHLVGGQCALQLLPCQQLCLHGRDVVSSWRQPGRHKTARAQRRALTSSCSKDLGASL